MSARNRQVGAWGERVAANYLQLRGYQLIARNVRTPYGEIDLVVEAGGQTIFVEVKTRTSTSLGPPEVAVTPRKQAHMLAASEHYAREHAIEHWQIDVVAVSKRTGMKPDITHFERALE
jgi:putative endonuclease